MSEESKAHDLGAVWRGQPEEPTPVSREQFVDRRTWELYSSTRSEILMSVVAAAFFVAVIGWRLAPAVDRWQQVGFAAGIAWVAITLFWYRDRLRREGPPRKDALAATGLEHYRRELQRHRDHLRNAWLWHGPLLLACVMLLATVMGRAFPGMDRLGSVLPLVLALLVWTGFGLRRRLLQAKELQREIDEMGRLSAK